MARVAPPDGYSNWNTYIAEQVANSEDQSIAVTRLIKRDIKLGSIASIDRAAGSDSTKIYYRSKHTYDTPGTVSPVISHPWS